MKIKEKNDLEHISSDSSIASIPEYQPTMLSNKYNLDKENNTKKDKSSKS